MKIYLKKIEGKYFGYCDGCYFLPHLSCTKRNNEGIFNPSCGLNKIYIRVYPKIKIDWEKRKEKLDTKLLQLINRKIDSKYGNEKTLIDIIIAQEKQFLKDRGLI